MKKNVFIHAWLAGNLGDDLFVKILCERYPTIQFCILSDTFYQEKYKNIKNLKVYTNQEKKFKIINELYKKFKNEDNGFFKYLVRKSDAVIHIGGSVFTQHSEDWSSAYEMDRFLVENSKKLFQISGNFGPYTDEKYYEAYHELFKKYAGICFRDKYSYEKFQDLNNVSWAPDVVFQYKKNNSTKKLKKAVIAPIDLLNRGGKWNLATKEKVYIEFHVKLVRNLLKENYNITMLSFCPMQGDGAMMQKILEQLSDVERKKIQCLAYTMNMEEIIQQFSDAEIAIGTRFHANILGFVFGCKVLPIIYDTKMEHVLEDIEYPVRIYISNMDGKSEEQYFNEIKKSVCVKDIQEMIIKSEKQFQYVDKFFEGR